HLTQLTRLDLAGNKFSGQIPSSIGNLVQLHSLYLDDNHFSGSIPDDLGQLTELVSIDLSFNAYLSVEPSNIFLLPNLEVLDLSNNKGLTGSFPSSKASNGLRLLALTLTRISVSLENDFFINLKLLEVLVLRE
ncbi:hypothetical protein D5086_022724, partial [Populus alba]